MESQPLASGATDSTPLQPSGSCGNASAATADDACMADVHDTAAALGMVLEHVPDGVVGDSHDASLGVIPPSDDEAEVNLLEAFQTQTSVD